MEDLFKHLLLYVLISPLFLICITHITHAHGMCWVVSVTLYMPYKCTYIGCTPLNWRHNGHDGVSNHQPHDCLLDRLSGRRSKKTSKLRVTGLCAGNSLVTGEFSAQMASNMENVSIWWRHHAMMNYLPYHGKTCITQRPLCIIPPTFIFWFHDIRVFFTFYICSLVGQ